MPFETKAQGFVGKDDVNNEDKGAWCKWGERAEMEFLNSIAPKYKLPVRMNPLKDKDKYATDFVNLNDTMDIDLKRRGTPFFLSKNYGYEPTYVVLVNHKDYLRYRHKYPDWGKRPMVILFWVTWDKQTRYEVTVDAMDGVWSLRLTKLDEWIRHGLIKCHEYKQRKNDAGTNAKHSWMIDLRLCRELKEKE